jgi:hypothetical protein
MTDRASENDPSAETPEPISVIGRLCTVACFAFAALGLGLLAMGSASKQALIGLAVGILIVAGVFLVFVFRVLAHVESAAKEQRPSISR